ncbi:MAG: hypothetical protein VR65_26580 [Desulfobulbaceae bacterium BRH_c16a]|nr:MAG: hypothetical protein VR65_26580 [Desulfobulbaceae bacterium BRH_c16a]
MFLTRRREDAKREKQKGIETNDHISLVSAGAKKVSEAKPIILNLRVFAPSREPNDMKNAEI